MVSRNDQIGWYGQDQAVEPPDTQLAVGPTELLEMTNSTGSIWSKTGTVISAVDLNAFFAVPAGSAISDPRVLYEAGSARWFASGVFFDAAFDSQVVIAVSQTADPSGNWLVYSGTRTIAVIEDQPKLGVTSDKVVLSWNDINASGTFLGQETWVLDKAAVLAGLAPATVSFGPDLNRFGLVPALHQSPSSVAYLAYNGDVLRGTAYAGAYAGIVAISGTPSQANVVWTEHDLAIVATQLPPNAQQPPPDPPLDTNDDRFLSAVWQNDILWLAGNDACAVGTNPVTSCARLIKVTTTAATPTIQQDIDAGVVNDGDFFFPAVGMDSQNNMVVVVTESASGTYPGVEATGEQANSSTLDPVVLTLAGQGQFGYNCAPCPTANGADRWGDYSGAQVDPSVPTTVWVAGEAMLSKTDKADWGTAAIRLTFTVASRLLNFGAEATSWGPGRLDVFMRGSDDALWHKFYASSVGWSDWSSLGMPPAAVHLASDPVAVSWGAGRIDVFVMGADNALWHKYYDGNLVGWSAWYSHGGTLKSGPAASSWGSGRLDVFYAGSDSTLRHIYYSSLIGAWSGEYNHGGSLASDPSAVSWGVGRIDVVARGNDGSLQHNDYDQTRGGWLANWETIPGDVLASGPSLTTWGAGRLDAFARGTDNTLHHTYFYAGSWQGWTSQANPTGVIFGADPGAAAWSAGRIDVYARGADGSLWHKYYDSSVGWSAWYAESTNGPTCCPG